MTWLRRYKLREFLRTAFWPAPVSAMILGMCLSPLVRWIDARCQWQLLNSSPSGTQAVLGAFVASMLTFIVFLYFAGMLGMSLRPVVVLSAISTEARRVIEAVYPFPHSAQADVPSVPSFSQPSSVVVHPGPSGALLAFDVAGLIHLASKCGCVLELVPRVGDYVAGGDVLFNVHLGSPPDAELLRQAIAIGPERTLRQDPALGFRMIVDIACRALSPAINDPTTATLALDQIHRLLRWVGTRRLDAGGHVDAGGGATVRCRSRRRDS